MTFKKLAIYLNYGKKGSGKSLIQARDVLFLLREYYFIEKKYPELKKRIIFSNQKFSKEIENNELNNHLFYWDNAKQLKNCPRFDCWKDLKPHPVHDTDILWDEIGKDLPAGSWTETPKWLKQIFSHLRKRGNRLFANTQVYEDIDISFRRQIDYAFEISKIFGSPDITATRPKSKFLWGVIIRREFDPRILEWEREPKKREDKQKDSSWSFPQIIFIRKKYVDAYDTTQEIPSYKPNTLEHVELWCENDYCDKHGKLNLEAKPRLEHYKI